MVLNFYDLFSIIFKFLLLFPFLSLNVLTYPRIFGNKKTTGLVSSSKYPIKYLELFFVSNFEITILSTLTSQVLIGFFVPLNSSFAIFVSPNFNDTILSKRICCHSFLANG